MKSSEWLAAAVKKLEQAGIGTGRLDALVLLEDISGQDRAWLLAHPEFELKPAQMAQLKKLLNRRAQHEPLAYLRGKTEFYGRSFVITPAVLEPRPESETMIDLFKSLAVELILARQPSKITSKQAGIVRLADVGAGSGALGITAKLELPELQVDLLEVDPAALKVAKSNVDLFTLSISVIKTNLLQGSPQNYDILLCNLPYVPDAFHISPAALREPQLAIFGGPDGLDLYRRLLAQVVSAPHRPLYILTESLPPQHKALQDIAAQHGYRFTISDDFIQVFQLATA